MNELNLTDKLLMRLRKNEIEQPTKDDILMLVGSDIVDSLEVSEGEILIINPNQIRRIY